MTLDLFPPPSRRVRYPANERQWVARLLARMTPTERAEYERRMAFTPGHHRTGRKYDGPRAQVAEQVMYERRCP